MFNCRVNDNKYLSMRAEVETPYRNFRLLLFGFLFVSAGIGFLFATPALIGAVAKAPNAQPLGDAAASFGIDLGVRPLWSQHAAEPCSTALTAAWPCEHSLCTVLSACWTQQESTAHLHRGMHFICTTFVHQPGQLGTQCAASLHPRPPSQSGCSSQMTACTLAQSSSSHHVWCAAALAIVGGLLKRDYDARQKQMRRMGREEALARCSLQLAGGKTLKLGRLRSFARPVIFCGTGEQVQQVCEVDLSCCLGWHDSPHALGSRWCSFHSAARKSPCLVVTSQSEHLFQGVLKSGVCDLSHGCRWRRRGRPRSSIKTS